MIHYKGGVRISMLCGRLALLDYRNRLKDEIRISNFLSAKVAQVPEAVEKLKQESQQKDGHIGEMWRQIFQLKLAVCPESHGPEEFLRKAWSRFSSASLPPCFMNRTREGLQVYFPEMMKLVCISMLLAAARQI